MPLLGGPLSEYCHPVWCGKTRVVWLPNGEKTWMTCLTVLTKYWHVTNRWTDGQTSWHGIVHAMHTCRAVETSQKQALIYNNLQCGCWCPSRVSSQPTSLHSGAGGAIARVPYWCPLGAPVCRWPCGYCGLSGGVHFQAAGLESWDGE